MELLLPCWQWEGILYLEFTSLSQKSGYSVVNHSKSKTVWVNREAYFKILPSEGRGSNPKNVVLESF